MSHSGGVNDEARILLRKNVVLPMLIAMTSQGLRWGIHHRKYIVSFVGL